MNDKTYVLLDGERVEASVIDPKLHIYLGMFRPAVNPISEPTCDVHCACGEILRHRGQEREHYLLKGCFDLPQYATAHQQKVELEHSAGSNFKLPQDTPAYLRNHAPGFAQYAGYCSKCSTIFEFSDLPIECAHNPCPMTRPHWMKEK